MEDRTVIEWDKDDLDALKIYKVDVLALGMLTALRKSFDLIKQHYGEEHGARHADRRRRRSTRCCARPIRSACSRSRAGRRCRCCRGSSRSKYYDLVVEVAIVRPGPIQGGMVHPYLKNRDLAEDQIVLSQRQAEEAS